MFKKLLSYLASKKLAPLSSSSQHFEIRGGTLTILHKDGNKTFDLGAGTSPELAAELQKMGLSSADLDNLVGTTQRAAWGKNKALVTGSPATIRESRIVFTTSSAERNAGSSQSMDSRASALGLTGRIDDLLKSGKWTHASLTLRANGQEHTFDTTSGISDELRQQMAQQLGISVEELGTLLKVTEQSAEQALEPGHLPALRDGQQSAAGFPSAGDKRQLVVCPRCARQVALAPRCLYCGEQLEGNSGVPIGP